MSRDHAIFARFNIKNRKRRTVFLRLFIGVGVIVCMVSVFWLITHAQFLQIEDVVVVGGTESMKMEIVSKLRGELLKTFWGKVWGSNVMIAWPNEIPKETLDMLPTIESLKIEKQYQNRKIIVHIKERIREGVWCRVEAPNLSANVREEKITGCWWFDRSGTLFKRGIATEGKFINMVKDFSGRPLGIGSIVLSDRLLKNMFSILGTLKNAKVNVREIELEDLSLEEITVRLRNGPRIHYSLRFGAENTETVLRDLALKRDFSTLEYVDFRVENRAYYR